MKRRLLGLARHASTLGADAGVPWLRRHGVYVPYRHAPALHAEPTSAELGWLRARFDQHATTQLDHLACASAHKAQYAALAGLRSADPQGARLDQDWFPGLDAAMAYAMVRRYHPARIIEVGSGHSTRWLARAIADAALATHLTSIDPHPRREIDNLCSTVLRTPLENVPLDVFDSLDAHDMLFIDSSHVALPGTDVAQLLTRVVPALRAGVLVHVHDIFLPFNYPDAWHARQYNEQLLVAALLGGGDHYQVLAANHYLRRCHPAAVNELAIAIAPGRHESSLWLRKQAT